jgi:hypothetical protein
MSSVAIRVHAAVRFKIVSDISRSFCAAFFFFRALIDPAIFSKYLMPEAFPGITKTESHILQRIAGIPLPAFEKQINARLRDDGELTTADVLRLEVAQRYKDRKSPPLPTGKFGVIYADPPYAYEFSHTHIRPAAAVYPNMSLEEICALPIGSL